MEKKLTSKDLINIGVFSAIYIILNVIISGFVLTPILQLAMLPVMALVCAPVYMLFIAKVQKFGAILIMGLLFSALVGLLVYGNIYCFLVNLLFFVVAEVLAYMGKYKNKKLNAISYIFAVSSAIAEAGLPWVSGKYFYDLSVASGYSVEWAEGVDKLATPINLLIMIGLVIVCGFISVAFSNKMFQKHFKKAGIA